MKQLLSLIIKEFRHIARDKRTILILLGMPIVQMILFGFAITTEVRNIDVAILDPSNDKTTKQIVERINANDYFRVTATIHNPQEIDRVLLDGTADVVIAFDNKFEEKLNRGSNAAVQLLLDATDPNTAITEASYLTTLIRQAQAEMRTTVAPATTLQITPNIRMLYNPQMRSAYNFVPGVMGLILMLICAMMTSISIVREKENGTMELLLASPVRHISVILSKAIPYFVLSCANILTILLLAVFVLNVPVANSIGGLTALSLIYILVCLSLGLLISTIARTQVAAMLTAGVLLMMPALLLSGMIYPVDNMPKVLEYLSSIVPARWYISAVKKLMVQGLECSYVWKELTILLSMAAGLIAVSIRKFKIRLQ